MPPPVRDVALALVGATVGLRFDRESLRHAAGSRGDGRRHRRMMVGSAALGTLLLVTLDTDLLTAYLATTPGGKAACSPPPSTPAPT